MKTIRILIADDHQLILSGIRNILKPVKEFEIIAAAHNGKEAVEMAIDLIPDVIFIDISMPVLNGIEATRIIHEKLPKIKILALTQHEENEYVIQFLNAGGSGYLLKNSTREDFKEAINTVMENNRYISKTVGEHMINHLVAGGGAKDNEEEQLVHLTKREKEIIQQIADDLSNQQIADRLNISLRTVETHRRNIMQKLKVKTVVSLLKYASLHDIISFD